MFLQKLSIQGFRCFDEEGVEITFQPGINVLIGENNTGKTALIDALRLGFSLGPGRRDIYVSDQDFHLRQDGTYTDTIALDFTFSGLTEEEHALYYDMLVLGPPVTAQLHLRYKKETHSGIDRIKLAIWGGEKEGQAISFETLELMNHVFLKALRDAESDLRPGRGSRLGQLLRKLVTEDSDRERILEHVVVANRNILREEKIKQAGEVLNRHLLDIERIRLRQRVRLGLVAPEFDRIADSLRVMLPPGTTKVRATFSREDWDDFSSRNPGVPDVLRDRCESNGDGVTVDLSDLPMAEQQVIGEDTYDELLEHTIGVFELHQNGMGYNNLIYMGAVLGDLRERKKAEPYSYNALLIEEPEAHLHPQLQDLVFDFLTRVSASENENSDDQRGTGEDTHEEDTGDVQKGTIQVFITSHSPTLTSRADIDSIIVLHENPDKRVAATHMRQCPLSDLQKADLRRYLDVTKSQLFFAKGVVLVEGISEALLLPVLAKRKGRRLDFNAVEVVNVSGTAFEPFALLFNSGEADKRINVPCAIITDDDRCTVKSDPNRLTEEDIHVVFAGTDRTDTTEIAQKANEICRKLETGEESGRSIHARNLNRGNLIVKAAYKTFEYELARISANTEPMLNALESIHPFVTQRLRELFESDVTDANERAVCFWLATMDTKARFAQRLAAIVDERDPAGSLRVEFEVPEYIVEVLEHVAPVEAE